MSSDLDQLVAEAGAAFAAVSQPAALENEKARFLGKSGAITERLKGLGKAEIGIDRKVLADMAVLDKPGFAAVVDKVKATLAA